MEELEDQLSVVMKFGGSSVSSAARMAEVAGLILTFPEERPVVVLSAMGKTTNNLLLAGEKAVGCGVIHVSEIEEWNMIKDLHIKTVDELGLPRSVIQDMLDELEQLLKGIAMMKELTPRTSDYLVSFGECMSTRIFAAYLNKIVVKARQYDAFDIGFMTTDEFGNADILLSPQPNAYRAVSPCIGCPPASNSGAVSVCLIGCDTAIRPDPTRPAPSLNSRLSWVRFLPNSNSRSSPTPMDTPPPPPPPIRREAWEGCSVLLDINDGDRLAFFRLTPGATVKIGNKTCSLQPLVGRPFGSLFRLGAGGLVPCATADATSRDHNTQDGADDQTQDETRDNRSLVDNNTAQNLSSDDIEAMKRDGATGDEIVEALIANSSTFGKKTVFSQEKYKLKKQKKYAPKVLLRRPSARSICETYFKKTPARIGFMRVDTLSLLLSMANIGAYSDVLVVDLVGGLVVGAVAERLGGTGYVCSIYLGSAPSSIDIVRMYNLSSDMVSRIVQAPISSLCSMQSSGNTPSVVNSSAEGEMIEPAVDEDAHASLAQQVDTAVSDEKAQLSTDQPTDMEVLEPSLDEHLVQDENSSLGGKDNDGTLNASKSPKPGKAPSPEKMKYWKEHGFSSLIVAAPGHEVERLVADLLPLLSYSAPFAIYHQYLEPLAKCMHSLQVSKMAIGLQLSEPWLREYQVLPLRTHPHMQMNAFGGYILSGIRIHNADCMIANK